MDTNDIYIILHNINSMYIYLQIYDNLDSHSLDSLASMGCVGCAGALIWMIWIIPQVFLILDYDILL